MSSKILVSSCLIGKRCSYDGASRFVKAVKVLCDKCGCIDVCPEMLGGLGSPREKSEIDNASGEDVLDGRGHVISISGQDPTPQFIRGAHLALSLAKQNNIKIAVMKSSSPSCGRGMIHSGKFDGVLTRGNGVTTALLLRNGIKVFTDREVEENPLCVSSALRGI
ncbi:MAG: DUF523 domain-containing protein [Candidatus Omnitrophica bacterium]|nr:DUF523 domain-containing protein [Candidatus Omnitrophota bacterium]